MVTDDDLRAIGAPALVLWTTKDPSGPVDEGRRVSEVIPRGRLAVMEKCGHWPQYEDAATFNRIQFGDGIRSELAPEVSRSRPSSRPS